MRKLITGLTAIVLTATMAVTSVASAEFTLKDTNGDGRITSYDASFIRNVAAGIYKAKDLTRLDVNENDVISNVDAMYYDPWLLSNPNTPDSVDSTNAQIKMEREFYVFDAKTGTYKRSYTLEVLEFDNTRIVGSNQYNAAESDASAAAVPPTASPDTLIGPDDSVTDWSKIGTAKIMTSGGYLGSGFVVDSHTIATAAHVVYNKDNNTPKKVSEILLFDSEKSSTVFTPVEYHISKDYYDVPSYNLYAVKYDYALITVKEDLSAYKSYELGLITDAAIDNELSVNISGFPQTDQFENTTIKHTKTLSSGNLKGSLEGTIRYDADASGGNSGSPVFTVESYNGIEYYTVIGIHCRGFNTNEPHLNNGARFDALTLQFYKFNMNQQW